MSIKVSRNRSCVVLVNHIPAGTLTEEHGQMGYIFTYNPDYLANEQLPPVSVTLPKTANTYSSKYLFPCFTNLLNEGKSKTILCRINGIHPDDSFGLLLCIAQIDTIGAITIQPIHI